jgi:hypothetical protein
MHADAAQQSQPAEVLIAFQNIASREKGPLSAEPYIHRVQINDSTMIATNTASILKDSIATRRRSIDGLIMDAVAV